MPLVLLTGYPNSGKTTVSKQLISQLKEKFAEQSQLFESKKLPIPQIKYYNDESMGIDKTVYENSLLEKNARAKIFSVVKRDLNKSDIVLIDSLNYIKGFRYQLHCEVKNLNTTFALVHVMNPNAKDHGTWSAQLYTELVQRYEEPNPSSNRWDTPYFAVLLGEDEIDINDLFIKLYPQLVSTNAKDAHQQNILNKLRQSTKPNSATIMNPASQSNYLTLLDQTTTLVLQNLQKWLKENPAFGDIHRYVIHGLENGEFIDIPPSVQVNLNIAKLQRLKRQFITMNRLRILGDAKTIEKNFIQYLNKNLSE
ncbi:hypothetical protein ACO0RG_001874 [Hanseniaspora osmophila]|uniref:Protein KTI12 n=1 Tax=Hanseniaspora osmophila TaxID=56408 RepID=A0A1E5RGP8_9ASCO|nr:Protein KTI12 [Hanseniaspora osmophila]